MQNLKRISIFIVLFLPLFLFSQNSTVIISEVLYDTPLKEGTYDHDGEFVSLYNYGNSTVDISGWHIEATSLNTATTPTYTYTFPNNTKINPLCFVVAAFRGSNNNFNVDEFYGFPNTDNKHSIFYNNSLTLPNGRTHLKIYSADSTLQDEIIYNGDDPRQNGEVLILRATNGLVPDRIGGESISLQRKNITITEGEHVFERTDYNGSTDKKNVRLFSFNNNNTLTVAIDGSHPIAVEEYNDIYNSGGSQPHPLKGSFSVSATGGASYTVPIDVPQGIRGMQPQLSLTYNSQFGMGIAGLGFHLQGLSAITRTGKNMFYDGKRTNDFSEFMLDGQRLKRLHPYIHFDTAQPPYEPDFSQSNSVVSTYRTADNPSLNSIKHYFSDDRFEVKTNESMTFIYGDNNNSSLNHSQITDQKLSYLLRESSDGYGNKIQYTYQENDGQKYIQKINYGTSITNTGTINIGTEIKFIYISNPVPQKKYITGGHEIIESLLLSRIEIYSNYKLLYYYELKYETPQPEKAYTTLKNVRKIYKTSTYEKIEELPLSFTWSAAENNHDLGYSDMSRFFDEGMYYDLDGNDFSDKYVSGDIDGDGSEDIIRFGWKYVYVYRNAGFAGDSGIAYSLDFTRASWGWGNKHPRYVVDINGDGCGDLVGQADSGLIVAYSKGFIPQDRIRTLNDQFENPGRVINDFGIKSTVYYDYSDACPLLFGDIDGDGLTDVLGIDHRGCKIYRNNKGNFEEHKEIISNTINATPYSSMITRRYKLLDIDADGKAELIVIHALLQQGHPDKPISEIVIIDIVDGLEIAGSSYNIKTLYMSPTFVHQGTNSRDLSDLAHYYANAYNYLFGDLNGDGLLDLVAINSSNTSIHYARSVNAMYDSVPDFIDTEFHKLIKRADMQPVSSGDINGDGLLDIIGCADIDATTNARLPVLLNTGNGFVYKVWGKWGNSDYGLSQITKLICDFNGDGISDVCTNNDSQRLYTSNLGHNIDFRKIISISDGSGTTTKITYDKYKKTEANILSFPFREISGLDVVSEIRAVMYDNSAYPLTFSHQKYSYNRAVADIRRGGLLGFLFIGVTDVINNTVSTTDNFLDRTRSMLYPIANSTYSDSVNDDNLLSSESYNYNEKNITLPYGIKNSLKYVSQKQSRDYLKGVIAASQYDIDNFGNNMSELFSVLFSSGKGYTFETIGTTEYLNYQTFGADNIIRRPLTKKTTSGYNNGAQLETITTYTYNDKGDILTETTAEGCTKSIYNNYGLPKEVTFIPKNEPEDSVTTLYGYTSDNRFLHSTLDDMGNITTKDYDLKYGRLNSETDIFGRTKSYKYDNYGRLKSTTDEDGVTTFFTESFNEDHSYRIIHTKTTTGASIYVYYDEFGREIITSTETSDGTINVRTEYNNKNQIIQKSEPFFNANNRVWRNYAYDNYGRLTQTEYRGDTTTYAYNGLTTTVTEHAGTSESRAVTKTYNATGDVIKISEPSGEITYHYYYPGLPDTIISGGVKTVIDYDIRGRRRSIQDPSANNTSYEYDNQNRIIKQTDANNAITTFAYDKYGRETSRTITATTSNPITITNTYNGIKGLLSESTISGQQGGNVTTSYTYDDTGRLTSETQSLDGRNFTTSYTYDAYGRLKSKTYPNGFGIKYNYDDFGEMSQITNLEDGNNIWQRGERNARGQYLSSTLGNNLFKASSYDEWGGLTGSHISAGFPFMTLLDSKTYTYDGANHLMTSRSNGYNGPPASLIVPTSAEYSWQENFTYDNEKRLKTSIYSFNNQIVNSKSQTYDTMGNLTHKSGVGNISYNSAFPFRIDEINSPYEDFSIPRTKENEKHLYGQSVIFTPFQRVQTIIQDSNDADFITSEDRADFVYNANYERVKMRITSAGSMVKQKYYAGDYELIQTYKFENGIKTAYETDICYIRTPEGLQATCRREQPSGQVIIGDFTNSNVEGEMFYFGTDHAGSITSVISEDGELLEHYRYDAWGNRRFMDNVHASYATYYPKITPTRADMRYLVLYEPMFDRGYIGEEHIDLFGLINLNARLYDPVLGRFLSPDPYVQAPDNLQNFNRYAYGLNNPLMYSDPNGDFFWLIPSIGWSQDGSFNIGLSFVFGIPGIFSAQVGIGYSFGNNDFSASVSATTAFNTLYASYSTVNGFSVGWSLGISPQIGLTVSTNAATMGVNYNITHNRWSGNVSAWSIDETGIHFNPSISAMIYPEHTTNLIRGQGFRSNDQVLERFVSRGFVHTQKALEYFGFKGTYDPFKVGGHGMVDQTGEIFYGAGAFEGGYDRLALVAHQEEIHSKQVLSLISQGIKIDDLVIAQNEYDAYMVNYKNQGLYRNHGFNLTERINYYGRQAGVYEININSYSKNYTIPLFAPKWWHFIYRIPRKW